MPTTEADQRDYMREILRAMIRVFERELKALTDDVDVEAVADVAAFIHGEAPQLAEFAAIEVRTKGLPALAAAHASVRIKPILLRLHHRWIEDETGFVAALVRWSRCRFNAFRAITLSKRPEYALSDPPKRAAERHLVAKFRIVDRKDPQRAVTEDEAREVLRILAVNKGAAVAADYVAAKMHGFEESHVRKARARLGGPEPYVALDRSLPIPWLPDAITDAPSAAGIAPKSGKRRRS